MDVQKEMEDSTLLQLPLLHEIITNNQDSIIVDQDTFVSLYTNNDGQNIDKDQCTTLNSNDCIIKVVAVSRDSIQISDTVATLNNISNQGNASSHGTPNNTHSQSQSCTQRQPKRIRKKPNRCKVKGCIVVFSSDTDADRHLQEVHKDYKKCTYEGCTTVLKPNCLDRHIQFTHLVEARYCEKCGRKIRDSKWECHKLWCISRRPALDSNVKVGCRICGLKIVGSQFKHHREICFTKGEKNVSCTFENCNAKFLNKKGLMNHVTRTHSQRVKCPQCEVYIKQNSLGHHMRVLHTGRKGKCNGCGEVMAKDKIAEHYWKCIELGERLFECNTPDCGRKFFQNLQLVHHMRFVHSPMIICTIDNCGQSLKRCHIAKHVRNRHRKQRIKCDTCGNEMFHENLAKHLEKCTNPNGKKYDCPVEGCKALFRNYAQRLVHLKDVHNNVGLPINTLLEPTITLPKIPEEVLKAMKKKQSALENFQINAALIRKEIMNKSAKLKHKNASATDGTTRKLRKNPKRKVFYSEDTDDGESLKKQIFPKKKISSKKTVPQTGEKIDKFVRKRASKIDDRGGRSLEEGVSATGDIDEQRVPQMDSIGENFLKNKVQKKSKEQLEKYSNKRQKLIDEESQKSQSGWSFIRCRSDLQADARKLSRRAIKQPRRFADEELPESPKKPRKRRDPPRTVNMPMTKIPKTALPIPGDEVVIDQEIVYPIAIKDEPRYDLMYEDDFYG